MKVTGWFNTPDQMLPDLRLWQRKLRLLQKLHLGSGAVEDRGLTDALLHVVNEARQGKIEFQNALQALADGLRTTGCRLNVANIRELLEKSSGVGMLEIHPSDVCNLKCTFCSFGRRHTDAHMSSRIIERAAFLSPRAVWISGGGEPTIYVGDDRVRDFADLVGWLRKNCPDSVIGFATNGLKIPKGKWQDHITWMRISLDAATPGSWQRVKGRDGFDSVCRNLRAYVEGPIPMVSVGFLYTPETVEEIPDFLTFVFDAFGDRRNLLDKVRLYVRAAVRYDEHGGHLDGSYCRQRLAAVDRKIQERSACNFDFAHFVRKNTNVSTLAASDERLGETCLVPLSYRALRSNGYLYPCIVSTTPGDQIADLNASDVRQELQKAELYAAAYYHRKGPHCARCPMPVLPISAQQIWRRRGAMQCVRHS